VDAIIAEINKLAKKEEQLTIMMIAAGVRTSGATEQLWLASEELIYVLREHR
jgi:hypothetical protein